ncbi:unannotated protein [freshwater metagenome]|uniref:Unannotated protein n=1 Tax=freshwater metagenome TaxID=449393 RepID=A0A6J7DMB4_9ZZZZ|nr:crotonase/enoyl-CoA hydratase family protein [Actinomycetota bacterium]
MSDDTQTAPILTERRDNVLIITLNRPEQRNSVNAQLTQAMAAAIDELDGADELSAGVITGAEGFFCSGMDLKAFVAGENMWHPERGFAGLVQKPAQKPLIAAVEGFAVAGGLEIALACDMIVAAEGAKLGIPEVKRSLFSAGGGLRQLPRKLPLNIVMELALTGDVIPAERGYELGLVNRVTAKGGALDAALELAGVVAANGPLGLRATKEIVIQQYAWTDEEFWKNQEAYTASVFASEDAREGATAFAEKRPPVWRGR